MRGKKIFIGILLGFWLVTWGTLADATTKIMLLGDSITYGVKGSYGGYRGYLYDLLSTAGYDFDFVGSRDDNDPGGIDPDHEGHPGKTADWIRDRIYQQNDDFLGTNPADVILLHIGTNDISVGQDADDIVAEVDEILDKIDQYESDNITEVTVILARIINRVPYNAKTTEFNTLLNTMAGTRVANGDKIVIADMENAFNYLDDMDVDGRHPNDNGYSKMAYEWFDALKGVLGWTFLTGNVIRTSPAIDRYGIIYVGSWDQNIYAINPDGSQKWLFPTGGMVNSSPGIGADGTIYVGSDDGRLYAINPNGTEKWKFLTFSQVRSSPAIACDGTIYVGTTNGKIHAVTSEGIEKVNWPFTTGGAVHSSPAIGADGTVYVGSYDWKLYAINPDGTQKWAFPTGATIYSSPAIGPEGTIYVGSSDHKLYAINANGTQKWAFPTGDMIYSSPAIGADGTVYVGSFDNNIYAIKPGGTEKWVFPTGDEVQCSPAVGSDGTIYVGSNDKMLYAINPDGSEKWAFLTGDTPMGGIRASSPAIDTDGTVYVGAYDYRLYAIPTSSRGLANSSWPMFHRDVRHTGVIALSRIILGLDFPEGQGWMEVVEANPPYTHVDWVRVPWPAYNTAVGATNPCLCNLDDDPYDELVVGLEAYPTSGGYVEIRDDATTGYAHLTWIRVPWPAYNAANGATYPTCGDFDGDGRNELAIGLGKYPTTGGYVEIRDDSTTGYAHQTWVRVPWPAYNSANGETRPAAGDFDGDGMDELAIGLGKYTTTGGYVEIRDDATTGFAHMAWPRVPWPAYNSSQGRTRPAAGDFDGDGKDELAIGLGTYTSTGGYVEIKDDASMGFAHMAWPRVPWPAYNSAYGATNPAAGDLDSDGKDELIIGLGTYPAKGGYVEIKDDDSMSYDHTGWPRVHWPAYNSANGETRPALGR